MKHFKEFSEDLADVDRRAVVVHGAAYGAFVAAAEMFGNLLPHAEIVNYRVHLQHKCKEASEQREQAVNVNEIWTHMMSCFRRGVFGETAPELRKFFKVDAKTADHPPGAENVDANGLYVQGRWKSYTLYIEIRSVMDLMRQDLRKQGHELSLEQSDFREQVSRRPYWHERNNGRNNGHWKNGGICLKQRFAGASLNCWAIDVDKFEGLGYRRVKDEVVLAAWAERSDKELVGLNAWTDPRTKWADPRKGDLFALIEAVETKPGETEE